MKKILWTAGAYLITILAQLVCIVAFLVLQTEPLKKGMILSILLLLSTVLLLVFNLVVKQEERAGRVDERLACILYLCRKQVSLLLSAGVLNLVVTLLCGFWELPLLVPSIAAILFVLACVIALVQLIRMTRPEEEAPEEEQAMEEAPAEMTEEAALAQGPVPGDGKVGFHVAGDLDNEPGENAGEP